MKKVLAIALLFLIYSCESKDDSNEKKQDVNYRIASGIPFNMLWNDYGVRKSSYLHLNLIDGQIDSTDINRKRIKNLCDLSEADNVGNPHDTWPYKYNTTNGIIQSPLRSASSFTLVSEGYLNSECGNYNPEVNQLNYPGYAIWILNKFTNNPLEFKMINSAKQLSGTRKLHEVGIIFEHWYDQWNVGRWAFKEQYNVNELTYIKPKFDVKTEHFNNYQSPNTIETQTYLTADLRIEYWKDGTKRRTDLVGVIFSNKGGTNGTDLNGNPNDNIFWQDTNPVNPRILLHGYRIGITPNLTTYPGNWTTIEFNYKPLIEQYLPAPPSGCTYENAIIVGFDIYSSTRSADINFLLKNIYLNSQYNY